MGSEGIKNVKIKKHHGVGEILAPHYDPQRILCMSHYLFQVQQRNRLQQKGLLRRFSIDCYGDEKHTKEKIRAEKTKRYKELKKHKGGKEWEYYFLNYKPG